MAQKHKTLQDCGLWLLDMACIIASYWIATNIRFAGTNDWGSKTLHYAVLVVFLLFYTIYSFFAEWNRNFLERGFFKELISVLKYNSAMILASLAFVFFMQWGRILSRQVIINFIWINLLMMYVVHILFRKVLRQIITSDKQITKVLVVALPELVDKTISRLQAELGITYQIVGSASVCCIQGDTDQQRQKRFQEMTEKLTQIPFDEVFLNVPGLTKEDVQPLIDGFEKMGVACHYNLGLPEISGASARVDEFGGFSCATYARHQPDGKTLLVKRAFDILGGLVGVILTGILTVFIAPAIKLDSPGPIFFAQTRIGKNGRRFKIYKFRSMYQDAEARKKELEKENEVQGLMFKMENDPRITKVGAFLRSTSLDEFPQFLNVLKGDMSLVGTRPPTVDEFEKYNEHYRRRLSMTPGLTGMWQVSGRSDISDFDEVVRLDLKYIDNWSLLLDLKILLQTVVVVLGHKGAK